MRTFATGSTHSALRRRIDAHGAPHWEELHSYPITDTRGHVTAVIETIRDVTEQRSLQEQLRQAQKMEAIGTLAGGVAHDFNNILTGILGYGEVVQMGLTPDSPWQEPIEQILAAAERGAQLTGGLLAFSRKRVIDRRPVDLSEVVRNVAGLLRRLIGEDIELSTALSTAALVVLADVGQMEQILMNLAANARDAMPKGGSLTITTQGRRLDASAARALGGTEAGDYAQIEVSDSGSGMDDATLEKAFEPFFTTKAQGKGTGLGLSIVYGIVKQHGGLVELSSELGRGTTFRILIPRAQEAVQIAAPKSLAPPARGTETILLAEDDPTVRALLSNVLRGHGYRVLEAADGDQALGIFAESGIDVDLLILDVIMPKKSGREVYDALCAKRSDLAVLFMSGYTADMIEKRGVLEGGLEFIAKPMSPFDLLRRVRRILDARA